MVEIAKRKGVIFLKTRAPCSLLGKTLELCIVIYIPNILHDRIPMTGYLSIAENSSIWNIICKLDAENHWAYDCLTYALRDHMPEKNQSDS
jgi:hypothetical protein